MEKDRRIWEERREERGLDDSDVPEKITPSITWLESVALDALDSLRRLVASIDAAGDDSGRQAEVLQEARAVCFSHVRGLREPLKDAAARWHRACRAVL